MARRVVACTACAATWTDRRARFCGRCGVPLAGSGDLPAGTDGAAARRRARLRLAGILAAAVAAAGLTVAASVTDLLSFPRGGDPEVALPTPEVVPSGNRLEPEETRTLRQQVDPNRLRCEPRGCELWRYSMTFDSFAEHRGYAGMVGLGDLVVMFDGTDLLALDRATGEVRWVESFADLLPAGASLARYGESEWQMLATLEDGIVVNTPGHVVRVETNGVRRWVTEARRSWGGEVSDDYLLLHGERADTATITVVDLDDGSIVWEREGRYHNTFVQDRRVVVTGARGIDVHDLSDGEVVWSHEYGPESPLPTGSDRDTWLSDDRIVIAAYDVGLLAAFDMRTGDWWSREYDPSGWPTVADSWIGFPEPDSSDVVLVDVATGADRLTLENANVHEWIEVDDAWVLLVTPRSSLPADGDDQHQPGPRVIGVDRDGEVLWEVPLEMERRCCTWLTFDGGANVAVVTEDDAGGTRTSLRIEVATGTQLDVDDDVMGWGHNGWQGEDGTWMMWGDHDMTLRKDGRFARVSPVNVWQWLEGTPWIFVSNGEILAVELVPDE